jgi:hypothetical protein
MPSIPSRAGAGTCRRALVLAAAGSFAGLGLLLLLALPTSARAAEPIKPWMPPGTDSLVMQVEEAKLRFQKNTGDSIGGSNYRAYELVGNAARRMLRAIGKADMIQARAVEAVLDSLGLDTDIVVDPELRIFAFLMVRNPYRLTAKAVGFLYWYKGNDLRMQGAQFSGGMRPQSRVWWTGLENAPYSWGIVDFAREDGDMHFTLFRLTSGGLFWTIAQYEDSGYRLGGTGTTSWVDMNGDQQPELVAYMPGQRDSLFEDCKDCPKPIAEMVFAERKQGFAIQDTRIVPSPYSTFERFVRLLADGSSSQAARLLDDPAKVSRAIAAGWNTRRPRSWRVEYAEPGTSWPAWMVVLFRGAQRPHRYTIYLEVKNGRWVIRDWIERELGASGAPTRSPGTVRPTRGSSSRGTRPQATTRDSVPRTK